MRLEVYAFIASLIVASIVVVRVVYIATPGVEPMARRGAEEETGFANVSVEGFRIVGDVVYLPYPRRVSNMAVEEAMLLRRSIREYTDDPVKVEDLSMILWAAYGISETRWGLKTTPSAGATYPLEIYVVIGERGVAAGGRYLKPGVYKYDPFTHSMRLVAEGDFRKELARAALGQEWVEEAPVNIVICAVFERTTRVYGERGRVRYVPMEVGHAGQNIYLMATALGYGTVAVGAFYDDDVARVIRARPNEVPMYIMPVGVPESPYRVTFDDIRGFIESRRG